MDKNRLWQIWYYLSIVFIVWAGFNFITGAPCVGEVSQRCGDINELVIFSTTGLAALNLFFAYRKYKGGVSWRLSWRGDPALGASFIAFFVFGGVFLGEHLPVIISFLAGRYGIDGTKPSMLDLGGIPDMGVMFVIYAVFGSILWLLFRFLSWPVVLTIGSVIAGFAERYVFIGHEEAAGGEDWVSNPMGAVLGTVVWGLISLLPYFWYRNIDRRWGGRGKLVAILIGVLLNVFSVGFFAYEKYVLKNSYQYRPPSSETASPSAREESNMLPANTCPDRLVEEAGKPTAAYWNGKTLLVPREVDNWVRSNCPGVLERIN